MKKYIKDKNGKTNIIDFFEIIDNGHVGYYVNNVYHKTKVYYRSEKTWNDHLGNTPFGYYTNVTLLSGEKRRIYIFD